jgi:uncharacterized protein
VTDADAITPQSLAPLLAEAGSIDVLLMGTGERFQPLSRESRQALEHVGLAPDLMSTGAAVRTYNVLVLEGRHVAAALIAVDDPHRR